VISNKKITFGVVGGIGPLAGADIFFKLVKSTPAYNDSGHFNVILEQYPLTEKDVYTYENYNSSQRKLHLYNVIKELVERKANAIILTCFISHTFIDELSAQFNIPIINMLEGIKSYVTAKFPKVKNIGILTSDFARKQKLFEHYFDESEYKIIYPDKNVQNDYIMEAIYGEMGIKAGHLTGKVIEFLEKACDNLVNNGAELIIPGFTEIPVVYDALKKKKRFTIIDTNQIYADYAIRFSTNSLVKKEYTIGIIGGVGPSATVDFMDKIIKNTTAKKDQDHFKMIIEHNPKIPDRTDYLINDGEDPTIALYATAKKLEKREADFIVIPCNTAHAFVDKIQKHLSIPIISMLEEVVNHIKKNYKKTKKVGLLATSGTINSGIYHKSFEKSGVRLISPDEENQKYVMDAIYGQKGIKAGYLVGECKDSLLKASEYLVKKGAQIIILGCTELPLALKEDEKYIVNHQEIFFLDPTNILAKKCVSIMNLSS
jgi:aspartate racemase